MYLATILCNRKYLCRDGIFYGIPQNDMLLINIIQLLFEGISRL